MSSIAISMLMRDSQGGYTGGIYAKLHDKTERENNSSYPYKIQTPPPFPIIANNSIIVVRLASPVLVDIWSTSLSVQLLLLRLSSGIKNGTLCLGSDPHSMSAMRCKAIRCRVVLRTTMLARSSVIEKIDYQLTQTRLSQKATSYLFHWKRTCSS